MNQETEDVVLWIINRLEHPKVLGFLGDRIDYFDGRLQNAIIFYCGGYMDGSTFVDNLTNFDEVDWTKVAERIRKEIKG